MSALAYRTQAHQQAIVATVKGTEMAASNHAFPATTILPVLSVCTNWVEKKFLLWLIYGLVTRGEWLTATIVDGRYTRLIIVKTLTAAASLVLRTCITFKKVNSVSTRSSYC